jgi:hypothetical protein
LNQISREVHGHSRTERYGQIGMHRALLERTNLISSCAGEANEGTTSSGPKRFFLDRQYLYRPCQSLPWKCQIA